MRFLCLLIIILICTFKLRYRIGINWKGTYSDGCGDMNGWEDHGKGRKRRKEGSTALGLRRVYKIITKTAS